jgi:hypothetical protein
MIVVLLDKPFKGKAPGTVLHFAGKAEGLGLIADGYGIEVRWDEAQQKYVPVRRVTVTVKDHSKGTAT